MSGLMVRLATRRVGAWLMAGLLSVAAALGGCADEDLAAPGAPSSGTGGTALGPGLTVAQARASRLDQPLLVSGYLVAEGDRVRLCEALAESHPPQCGGAFIEVRGLDLGSLAGLEASGDVRWSARPRQLLGEVKGGVMTTSGTSKG